MNNTSATYRAKLYARTRELRKRAKAAIRKLRKTVRTVDGMRERGARFARLAEGGAS